MLYITESYLSFLVLISHRGRPQKGLDQICAVSLLWLKNEENMLACLSSMPHAKTIPITHLGQQDVEPLKTDQALPIEQPDQSTALAQNEAACLLLMDLLSSYVTIIQTQGSTDGGTMCPPQH